MKKRDDMNRHAEKTVARLDINYLTVKVGVVAVLLVLAYIYVDMYGYLGSWIPLVEIAGSNPSPGTIFPLLVLILLINPLSKVFRRKGFTRQELALIYIVAILAAAGVNQFSLTIYMFVIVGWFTRLDPTSYQPYFDSMSEWIGVKDMDAIGKFFAGSSSVPWGVWLKPMITWTVFTVILFLMAQCLAVLFRRRWEEQERLSYPLIVPIAEMVSIEDASERTSFWKDALMWYGFGIAAVLMIPNHLQQHFPGIPGVNFGFLGSVFRAWVEGRDPNILPWGFHYNYFSPFWVGLGYLLSTDLLFSAWFFTFMQLPVNLLLQSIGYLYIPGGGVYLGQSMMAQFAGALVGLGLFQLWLAKGELKILWKMAFQRETNIRQDDDTGLSYSVAFVGCIVGFVLLVSFLWLSLNISLVMSLCFVIFMVGVVIGNARLRTEAGFPYQAGWGQYIVHQTFFFSPISLGTRNLFGLSFLSHAFEGARTVGTMAGGLESMKLAKDAGVSRRTAMKVGIAAFIIGFVAMAWFSSGFMYDHGANVVNKNFSWYRHGFELIPLMDMDFIEPQAFKLVSFFVGAGVVALLGFLRSTFVWWPFHPAGYIMAANFMMSARFVGFFIAWLVKCCVVRYGGPTLLQKLRPVFIGMIVGEIAVVGIFSFVGVLVNVI